MERREKEQYYLDIAQTVASRGTCLRRNFGAIIVKNDQIISTGYAGAPRGRKNCCDLGYCRRQQLGIPAGQRYELCRSVHAEMNAVLSAAREQMIGATLYLVGIDASTGALVQGANPCLLCKRLIINAGISKTVIRDSDGTSRSINTIDWIYKDDSLSDEHLDY